VMLKSDSRRTGTVVVAMLFVEFGSLVTDDTVPVVVMMDSSTALALTFTTNWTEAVVLIGKLAALQVTVPVPPTLGVLQPIGAVNETNVVFAGIGKLKVTVDAVAGPLLVMVASYVRFWPATTGTGVEVAVIARSAWVPTVTELVYVATLSAGILSAAAG